MSSDEEEERAFERLRREFPEREVSLEKKWRSWRDKISFYAYAAPCADEIYENNATSTYLSTKDNFTADEAVDTLIKLIEEEKKWRAEAMEKWKRRRENE